MEQACTAFWRECSSMGLQVAIATDDYDADFTLCESNIVPGSPNPNASDYGDYGIDYYDYSLAPAPAPADYEAAYAPSADADAYAPSAGDYHDYEANAASPIILGQVFLRQWLTAFTIDPISLGPVSVQIAPAAAGLNASPSPSVVTQRD